MNDTIKYITGLDLGQAAELTGLAVLEQTTGPNSLNSDRRAKYYAVRHLERFALGTSFPAVCDRLRELFSEPPLAESNLVVDQTVVGPPVVKLLRRARLRATIRPVTITAGNQTVFNEDGSWSVPKRDLVSTLQVLLQSRRIKVAPTLSEAKTLVQELTNFRVKATLSATETLESWREGPHDDLVLAVAIAAWQSERLLEYWIR
jgi:hypothetical protein